VPEKCGVVAMVVTVPEEKVDALVDSCLSGIYERSKNKMKEFVAFVIVTGSKKITSKE
jgi:hypothetical protein